MKDFDDEFEEQFQGNLDDILRNARSEDGELGGLEGPASSELENRRPRQLDEKEVKVMGVYEHQEQGMPPAAFVLLRDNRGRQVLIWIGRFEAYAISVALEGVYSDRPMTHDLLKHMVDRLGGTVERITIDDLWQETYYAKISISTGTEMLDVDARPSDAVALALRANAPIYMAESVLDQADVSKEI